MTPTFVILVSGSHCEMNGIVLKQCTQNYRTSFSTSYHVQTLTTYNIKFLLVAEHKLSLDIRRMKTKRYSKDPFNGQ